MFTCLYCPRVVSTVRIQFPLWGIYILHLHRCTAPSADLDGNGMKGLRSQQATMDLKQSCTSTQLWSNHGIVPGVTVRLKVISKIFPMIDSIKPFTAAFPRADIHELIAPDILHQVIKPFRDHLVSWVEKYFKITWGEKKAKKLMDELDHW